MKLCFRRGGIDKIMVVLSSLLLLSACAINPQTASTADVVSEQHPKTDSVEAQQPVSSDQGNPPLKKPKHNVEED